MLIAIVVAQAMIFLVSATVWAHEQAIGTHNLDKLNVASGDPGRHHARRARLRVCRSSSAVKNIGQNVPEKPIAK